MATSPPLKFKKLSADNWVQPDPVQRHFVAVSRVGGTAKRLTGDDWASQFLAVELAATVPQEVKKLFEVARGICLYGWFFYPLYHLGEEQLFRVADTAVAAKCKAMGGPDQGTSFAGRLDWLKAHGILTGQDRRWWDAIRELRNLSSNPDFHSIHPPGSVLRTFRDVAKAINGMFESAPHGKVAPAANSAH